MGVHRLRLPGHRLREGGLGRRQIPLPEVEGRERELELRSVFEVSPCCLEATKGSAHFLGRPRRPGHQEEGVEPLRVSVEDVGCLLLSLLRPDPQEIDRPELEADVEVFGGELL